MSTEGDEEIGELAQGDEEGKVMPLVEESIKPDVEKEKSYLVQEMKEISFELSLKNFKDALNSYATTYKGSIALLRCTLESLVREIINKRGIEPFDNFTDTIGMLPKVGLLKATEKNEETGTVTALWRMLSHYGSHPELVDPDTANFLYVWSVCSISFLLKRFKSLVQKQ